MKTDKLNLNSMLAWLRKLSITKKAKIEPVPAQPVATDLTDQQETPTQTNSASFQSILRKAVAEADDIANSIKTRARAEAEAEAKRIIAQANLETQEIKGKAQIEAQREAEEILSSANKKAEMIEVEAKQKVLQLLAAISKEIENELKSEYERAYSRLSSSLHNLIEESHNIEEEFKSRREKLLENKKTEIKEYEAVLLGMPEASSIEIHTPPEVKPKGESKTEVATKKVEQIVKTQERKNSEEQVKQPAKIKFNPFSKIIRVEKREPLTKEVEAPIKTEVEPLTENTAQAKVHKQAEEPVEIKAEPAVEKSAQIEDIAQAPANEVVKEPVKPEIKEEKIEKQDHRTVPLNLDSQALYTGEVELIIAPPAELKLVSKLYNYLQTVPELKILYTRGSWDQGTTVTLALEKPLPLINILSETPEIKVTSELAEDSAPGKSSSIIKSERRTGRIKLNLQER